MKFFEIVANVEEIEEIQQKFKAKLESSEQQQNDMKSKMNELETEVNDKFEIIAPTKGVFDLEREKVYTEALKLDNHLNEMNVQIDEMFNSLNEAREQCVDTSNPITQIEDVLNSQLETLNWVSEKSDELQLNLKKLSNLV